MERKSVRSFSFFRLCHLLLGFLFTRSSLFYVANNLPSQYSGKPSTRAGEDTTTPRKHNWANKERGKFDNLSLIYIHEDRYIYVYMYILRYPFMYIWRYYSLFCSALQWLSRLKKGADNETIEEKIARRKSLGTREWRVFLSEGGLSYELVIKFKQSWLVGMNWSMFNVAGVEKEDPPWLKDRKKRCVRGLEGTCPVLVRNS